eukprot:12074654-Alexandrium_andersonii.AAC.1
MLLRVDPGYNLRTLQLLEASPRKIRRQVALRWLLDCSPAIPTVLPGQTRLIQDKKRAYPRLLRLPPDCSWTLPGLLSGYP